MPLIGSGAATIGIAFIRLGVYRWSILRRPVYPGKQLGKPIHLKPFRGVEDPIAKTVTLGLTSIDCSQAIGLSRPMIVTIQGTPTADIPKGKRGPGNADARNECKFGHSI